MEEACGSVAVDILATAEGLNHRLVTAQVGHQAQLHLRVVGSKQNMVAVGRHKGLANQSALLLADGDVL